MKCLQLTQEAKRIDRNLLIYIEKEYDEYINSFILTHMNKIILLCKEYELSFAYIPLMSGDIGGFEIVREIDEDLLSYSYGRTKVIQDSTFLNHLIVNSSDFHAALIHYDDIDYCKEHGIYQGPTNNLVNFVAFEIDPLHSDVFFKELETYLQYRKRIIYSEPEPLVITEKLQIYLRESNREIVLDPMDKAVFLLFLRHPEGIVLKYMSDYEEELYKIYSKVSRFSELSTNRKNVMKVCDVSKNLLNEKISHIKQTFIKSIGNRDAEAYIIVGKPTEAKRINLSPRLISFPDNINSIEKTNKNNI